MSLGATLIVTVEAGWLLCHSGHLELSRTSQLLGVRQFLAPQLQGLDSVEWGRDPLL